MTDAKLLCFASISSLNALETVSFNSLFFVPSFKFFLSLFSLSPLSLFVALCSASFLFSKSFVISGDLGLNEGFKGGGTSFLHSTFKPKSGYALIFPSNWCYPHAGEPVEDGVKRVAVTWYYVVQN